MHFDNIGLVERLIEKLQCLYGVENACPIGKARTSAGVSTTHGLVFIFQAMIFKKNKEQTTKALHRVVGKTKYLTKQVQKNATGLCFNV